MGIEWDLSGLDNMFDHVRDELSARSEEAFAEELARRARGLGLESVDSINLDIKIDGDPGQDLKIDEARVRVLANQILASGGGHEALVDEGDLDDDSGFGENSYFNRAMNKDD